MTRTSARFVRHLSLLAIIALIAAACGLTRDSSDVAASVTFPDGDEVELDRATLDSYYDTLAEDTDFVVGAYQGTVPDGLRSSILTDMIVNSVVNQLVDREGVEVSAENDATGRENIVNAVASLFQLDEDPAAAAEERFENLPYLSFLAQLQGKQLALGEALVADEAAGETVEVPCASHILLETEADANDVIAELEAGADFAELAMERSTGPSAPNGGDLGCSDPASFVEEFAAAITDAPLDTIIGPVETEFGFHVITVTGVEEQTVGGPDEAQLVSSSIVGLLSQLEVDIDPSIGEWNGATSSITPAGAESGTESGG